jgi:hypothetical protein
MVGGLRLDINDSEVMELKADRREGKTEKEPSRPRQTRLGVSPESDFQDDEYDLQGWWYV